MKREEPHWPFLTIALLGLWLLASPVTYGYGGSMLLSDIIAGGVAVIAGILAIMPRSRWWARWVVTAIGFWLLFAPLVLETAYAAAYLNSTAIGTLLIAMAIVIPRGLNGTQQREPEVPPGWTYNPSSWVQRTPIIVLALINFLLARYMAAYQLGHVEVAWDPMFGEGTHNVLTSDISEAFPISDAGLGAVAYMIEALIACIGNASRWRTAPWVVALFGVLVVPVGVVSIVLIMLQPVAVGDWCFLCLVTALIMLLMAVLAIPEVAALCWFMWKQWRGGQPFWRTFIYGGHVDGGTMQEPPITLTSPPRTVFKEMVSGLTVPWTLLICAPVGAWLMSVPEVFKLEGLVADSHSIAGALLIVFAVLAMAEPTRALRFVNILIGIAIAATPFLLGDVPTAVQINALIIGAAVIALSIPRGPIRQTHGAWQRFIK